MEVCLLNSYTVSNYSDRLNRFCGLKGKDLSAKPRAKDRSTVCTCTRAVIR
jgi:hypothetical protein